MILFEIYGSYGPNKKRIYSIGGFVKKLQPFEIREFGDYSCDQLSGLRKNLHFNL
jgi:hypothetical protein